MQRDSGAIDAQLFPRASQLGQSIGERLRTCKHERDRVEKTPQFAGIIFNLWFYAQRPRRGKILRMACAIAR